MERNRRIQIAISASSPGQLAPLLLRAPLQRKGNLRERLGACAVSLWEGDEGLAVCEDAVEEVEVGVLDACAGVWGGDVVCVHDVEESAAGWGFLWCLFDVLCDDRSGIPSYV